MKPENKTWAGSLIVFAFIYLFGFSENAYHGIGCIGGVSVGSLLFMVGVFEQYFE